MREIEDLKNELEYCQAQYRIAKENFEFCKKSLKDAQMEFRIGEVERVLNGMHILIGLGETNGPKLDGYIAHCLSCLRGNIDGVVISIDKDIEKVQEEMESDG